MPDSLSSSSTKLARKNSTPTVLDLVDSDSDSDNDMDTGVISKQTISLQTTDKETTDKETTDNGSIFFLPKEKQISGFIRSLMEIVTCPINMEIFMDPVVTPQDNVFEEIR